MIFLNTLTPADWDKIRDVPLRLHSVFIAQNRLAKDEPFELVPTSIGPVGVGTRCASLRCSQTTECFCEAFATYEGEHMEDDEWPGDAQHPVSDWLYERANRQTELTYTAWVEQCRKG